jgi:hypothetical protein
VLEDAAVVEPSENDGVVDATDTDELALDATETDNADVDGADDEALALVIETPVHDDVVDEEAVEPNENPVDADDDDDDDATLALVEALVVDACGEPNEKGEALDVDAAVDAEVEGVVDATVDATVDDDAAVDADVDDADDDDADVDDVDNAADDDEDDADVDVVKLALDDEDEPPNENAVVGGDVAAPPPLGGEPNENEVAGGDDDDVAALPNDRSAVPSLKPPTRGFALLARWRPANGVLLVGEPELVLKLNFGTEPFSTNEKPWPGVGVFFFDG